MNLKYKNTIKYDKYTFYRLLEVDLHAHIKRQGFSDDDFNYMTKELKELLLPSLDQNVVLRMSQLTKGKNILDYYIPVIRRNSRNKDMKIAAALLADFIYEAVTKDRVSLSSAIECFTRKSPSTKTSPRTRYEYTPEKAEFIDRIGEQEEE